MEDDRRQLLEEAVELDHVWGIWEEEAERASDAAGWLQQVSLHKGDMRHHVEARVSHREQRESPSASQIERDPEVIPDVDIAARMGRDLLLDETLPRHE